MGRRLKVTTDRDVPLWGTTKKKTKQLQRERDLHNGIKALKDQLEGARGATSHYAGLFHKYQAAMPSDHRIACLAALVKMPIATCFELGILAEMTVLSEWHRDLMKALEEGRKGKPS